MKSAKVHKAVWFQFVVFLAVCLAALPLAPLPLLASTSEISASARTGAPRTVVLNDQKKMAVKQQNPPGKQGVAVENPSTGAGNKARAVPLGETASRSAGYPAEETGMSTMTKIGIGVGAAALVGVGLALAGGGGSDSGPAFPTAEGLVGKWSARATSHVDKRTYTGVYDLYAVGSHTYDIFITGDNVRKQGRGNWTLVAGTNTLRVENEGGSVYIGEFQNENFTTITLTNQYNRWELVLTRQ